MGRGIAAHHTTEVTAYLAEHPEGRRVDRHEGPVAGEGGYFWVLELEHARLKAVDYGGAKLGVAKVGSVRLDVAGPVGIEHEVGRECEGV